MKPFSQLLQLSSLNGNDVNKKHVCASSTSNIRSTKFQPDRIHSFENNVNVKRAGVDGCSKEILSCHKAVAQTG